MSGMDTVAAGPPVGTRTAQRIALATRAGALLPELSHDIVAVLGLDGRPRYLNAAGARVLGRTPDELQQLRIIDLVHPADRFRVLMEADRLVENPGTPVRCEVRLERADGTHGSFVFDAQADETERLVYAVGRDITDRLRSEDSMRLAVEMVQDGFENAPIGMALTDSGGNALRVNRAFCEMIGRPESELLGTNLHDLVHPEERGASIARRRKMSDGRAPNVQTELRFVRPDGSVVWAILSAALITDSRGGPLMFFCQIEDITERRRSEEEAHEAATRLSEAQRIAHLGSWQWDIREDRITWSDELFRIFGLEPQQFGATYEAYIERVHPEDRDAAAQDVRQAVEQATGFESERRIIRPDGSVRWLWSRGIVEADPDGRATRMIGICHDITERVAAEEELRRLSRQNEVILNSAGEGIFGIDLEGRITFVNPAGAAMLGWEVDALQGRYVHETISALKRSGRATPTALASGPGEERSGEPRRWVEVFRQRDGASFAAEYVSTPIVEDGRLTGSVVTFRDVTERRRFVRQLRYLADHDALTGLFNRRRFKEEVGRKIREVSRYETGGAVLLLDLDNFKSVNDTFGHQVGDELIAKVARKLERRVRASDVLARLGGDEFAVVTPQADEQSVRTLAQDLLAAVRTGASLVRGHRTSTTTSIGIALFGDEEQTNADELLVRADVAMYAAKDGGRDRYSLFVPSDGGQPGNHRRRTWLDRIRAALDTDSFVLHAQPILELGSGEVNQHELLLRMKDESGELVPPGAFIPTAERFGVVQDIDTWVTLRAIHLLAEHARRGSPVKFEVNLSGTSIGDTKLTSLIERAVDATGVDPQNLIFEITETAAIANLDEARLFAERLTSLGCQFALDDFGTGFGSFSYLKHLPLNYLKIDGDFIQNIVRSETDRRIVQSVVTVAQGLGQRTVGEFAGSDEVLQTMRAQGVDYAQGFHVGRPRPVEELLPG